VIRIIRLRSKSRLGWDEIGKRCGIPWHEVRSLYGKWRHWDPNATSTTKKVPPEMISGDS
jgi:hypothetical protein